jgi:hypothetical protein
MCLGDKFRTAEGFVTSLLFLSGIIYVDILRREVVTCQQLKFSNYSSVAVISGFGGLEVACWPLVPKFAGSHPAEAVGF